MSLAAVGLATYWGTYVWGPELVREVSTDVPPDVRAERASFAFLLMNFGCLPGLLAFAPLANRFGRRATFAAYQIAAMVLAPATFLLVETYGQALVMLPVMATVVVGLHAGYAIYFPELFPTRLRNRDELLLQRRPAPGRGDAAGARRPRRAVRPP